MSLPELSGLESGMEQDPNDMEIQPDSPMPSQFRPKLGEFNIELRKTSSEEYRTELRADSFDAGEVRRLPKAALETKADEGSHWEEAELAEEEKKSEKAVPEEIDNPNTKESQSWLMSDCTDIDQLVQSRTEEAGLPSAPEDCLAVPPASLFRHEETHYYADPDARSPGVASDEQEDGDHGSEVLANDSDIRESRFINEIDNRDHTIDSKLDFSKMLEEGNDNCDMRSGSMHEFLGEDNLPDLKEALQLNSDVHGFLEKSNRIIHSHHVDNSPVEENRALMVKGPLLTAPQLSPIHTEDKTKAKEKELDQPLPIEETKNEKLNDSIKVSKEVDQVVAPVQLVIPSKPVAKIQDRPPIVVDVAPPLMSKEDIPPESNETRVAVEEPKKKETNIKIPEKEVPPSVEIPIQPKKDSQEIKIDEVQPIFEEKSPLKKPSMTDESEEIPIEVTPVQSKKPTPIEGVKKAKETHQWEKVEDLHESIEQVALMSVTPQKVDSVFFHDRGQFDSATDVNQEDSKTDNSKVFLDIQTLPTIQILSPKKRQRPTELVVSSLKSTVKQAERMLTSPSSQKKSVSKSEVSSKKKEKLSSKEATPRGTPTQTDTQKTPPSPRPQFTPFYAGSVGSWQQSPTMASKQSKSPEKSENLRSSLRSSTKENQKVVESKPKPTSTSKEPVLKTEPKRKPVKPTEEKKANLKLKVLTLSDAYAKTAQQSMKSPTKERSTSKTSQSAFQPKKPEPVKKIRVQDTSKSKERSASKSSLKATITTKKLEPAKKTLVQESSRDKLKKIIEPKTKPKPQADNEETRKPFKQLKTAAPSKQTKPETSQTSMCDSKNLINVPVVQYLSLSQNTSIKQEFQRLNIQEKSKGKSFSNMAKTFTLTQDSPEDDTQVKKASPKASSKIQPFTVASKLKTLSPSSKVQQGKHALLSQTSASTTTPPMSISSNQQKTLTQTQASSGRKTVKKIGENNFNRMMADLNQKLIDDLRKELDN